MNQLSNQRVANTKG